MKNWVIPYIWHISIQTNTIVFRLKLVYAEKCAAFTKSLEEKNVSLHELLHMKEMWRENFATWAWMFAQHLKACDSNHIEHKQGEFIGDHFETWGIRGIVLCYWIIL